MLRLLLPFLAVTGIALSSSELRAAVDPVIMESLRVVEDPDGFTNLRAAASRDAKIVGRVSSGAIIAIEPELTGDWAILFRHTTVEAPQYIHSSRLRSLAKWRAIAASNPSGILKTPGFEVRLHTTPFMASEHKITENENGMKLVDGQLPWGQDGGLPKHHLGLSVTQNGAAVDLPETAVENLYEPNMESVVILTPSDAGKHAVVVMLNSDGAGGYCVAWAFQGGTYRGRTVYAPF